MNKIIEYGADVQAKIVQGFNEVGDLVQSTYGPAGRNVIMYDGGYEPRITKDGASAAQAVDSDDPWKKTGILLIRGIIDKVNALAGDGSTTTTLYARSLLNECYRLSSLGFNVRQVRKGIEDATNLAIEYLKSKSTTITTEDVYKIALLSANGNEEIASLFQEAFNQCGPDGVVTLDESYRRDCSSYVQAESGIEWEAKPVSEDFIIANDHTTIANPLVLLFNANIVKWEDIAAHVDLAEHASKGLIVIAQGFDQQVVVAAKSRGVMLVYGPDGSKKDLYKDLSAVLYTPIIKNIDELHKIQKIQDFGTCEEITQDLTGVTIIQSEELTEAHAKYIQEHVEYLKGLLNTEDTLTESVNTLLRKRIAKLSGGIIRIHMGALTSTEREEKADLMEDALNSVYGALNHGILPGGGIATLKCSEYLKSIQPKDKDKDTSYLAGYSAVIKALRVPATVLLQSVFPDDYQYLVQKLAKTENFNTGINLLTTKEEDLITAGIVDNAYIEYTCIEYTAATAGAFLLSNGVVVNERNNITHGYNSERIMRG